MLSLRERVRCLPEAERETYESAGLRFEESWCRPGADTPEIEAFLKEPASANAREIEHANEERIAYVPTDDPLVTANVDTLEDYASLKFRL